MEYMQNYWILQQRENEISENSRQFYTKNNITGSLSFTVACILSANVSSPLAILLLSQQSLAVNLLLSKTSPSFCLSVGGNSNTIFPTLISQLTPLFVCVSSFSPPSIHSSNFLQQSPVSLWGPILIHSLSIVLVAWTWPHKHGGSGWSQLCLQ